MNGLALTAAIDYHGQILDLRQIGKQLHRSRRIG